MKNGNYKDWQNEARFKMAIYKEGKLVAAHYSFFKDDVRNSSRPEATVSSMLKRLIYSGKYTDFDLIIFFNNRQPYPHDIDAMFAKGKSGVIHRVSDQKQENALNYYDISQ